MKPANIFAAIPAQLDEELTDLLVQNKNVTIERIVSKGHTSPATGWFDQEKDEWVMVLQGAAILAFEDGEDVRLARGDHLTIPAHRRHRLKWSEPDVETVWLAVYY